MLAALEADAGWVNVFRHNRAPTSIDGQTVIRMNRDTLYSFAIVDISEGATLTVPDSGDRYLSVMVVTQDPYITRVVHDPGRYDLTVAEFETPWVLDAVRVLVDRRRAKRSRCLHHQQHHRHPRRRRVDHRPLRRLRRRPPQLSSDHRTAGTTSSGSTPPARKSSTAPGPSPPSNQPDDAVQRSAPQGTFRNTGLTDSAS